jgi:hypothetical protein
MDLLDLLCLISLETYRTLLFLNSSMISPRKTAKNPSRTFTIEYTNCSATMHPQVSVDQVKYFWWLACSPERVWLKRNFILGMRRSTLRCSPRFQVGREQEDLKLFTPTQKLLDILHYMSGKAWHPFLLRNISMPSIRFGGIALCVGWINQPGSAGSWSAYRSFLLEFGLGCAMYLLHVKGIFRGLL